MSKLSFDGKGINDKSREYSPRVATFSNLKEAEDFGQLFEAAPDLLTALTNMVKVFNVEQDKIDALAAFITIERARHVIEQAEKKSLSG